MPISAIVRTVLAATLVCLSATRAAAQTFDLIGTRAQGMGGAFVAVADDATATWWNPAGIATGALFALQYDRGLADDPESLLEPGPARRARSSGFAFSYPALGLSYYSTRTTEMSPLGATAKGTPVRQEDGTSPVVLRSFSVSQYGATFAQSTGGSLTIATTVKLMRGAASSQIDSGAPGAIERAEDVDLDADTELDVDVGVMAAFPHGRVGLTVRNLSEPAFGDKATRTKLGREARAGIALMSGQVGPIDVVTVAFDADFTTTTTVMGEVRQAATGAEVWLFGRHVAVRGGLTRNTAGDSTTDRSWGASVGVAGIYLDGAMTTGENEGREGWRLGLRVTF